jgi:hypothetical protein
VLSGIPSPSVALDGMFTATSPRLNTFRHALDT